MTEVYPMSKIDIFVQVLQSDGGKHNPLFLHLFAISHLLFLIHTANKAVCINAATMALIDAGVPMKDFVCACSSSLIEDTPVVGMKIVTCLPPQLSLCPLYTPTIVVLSYKILTILRKPLVGPHSLLQRFLKVAR